MGKQIAVVALLALVFGGAGSSALLTRAGAQSKPLSAAQHGKRLGPKPTPQWYWHWLHWRLHGRKGNRLDRGLRPKDAPLRIQRWAWGRLHFFLLARATNKHNGQPTTTHGKPSSGSVYFDARAKRMSKLYSYETTPGDLSTLRHSQSPNIWTCLCFTKNDISLVQDSRYGRAYKVAVATGDTNPWGGSDSAHGAAQLSTRRTNDLGRWDYFAFAAKVPSWNGPVSDLFFSTLASFGYQTSQGDQVALGLQDNHGVLAWSIRQNAGYANNATGWAAGTTAYQRAIKRVTYGKWEEFVIGVKWSTHKTGELQVHNRVPGGRWSMIFDKKGIDTELYGTTPNGTFAQGGSNWPTVIDKIGLYFQEYGGESETVYESSLSRSSDLATAKSTVP